MDIDHGRPTPPGVEGDERDCPRVRSGVAWRDVLALSVIFTIVEIAVAGGYGYHRDELYFVTIGRFPAFGYVDEPPLVPLLAHALDSVFGHSLYALRVPAALAGGAVVLLTGMLAREFGARRREQSLAATCMAVSGFTLGTSHLLSTSTFDLLVWTALLLLVVRAIRGGGRSWLAVGVVAGVGLEIKTLPVFLLFALTAGLLAVGPRSALRSRWLAWGVVVAAALWLPNLAWQATHGWPQLTLSSSIAAGTSGSSQPRGLFLPFQFLLMSPPLCPVWLAGLWRLARDPRLALWRAVAVAYLLLIVIFVATGGKPYYLCGMYPALFAAGAEPVVGWFRASTRRLRLGVGVLVLATVVDAAIALPLVPVRDLRRTPVVAMNYDAGEQVGWPAVAATVRSAYLGVPAEQRAHTVVVGANYGEAAALLRYAPDLPAVYGAQNSMWDLGRPPDGTTTAVVVGFPVADLHGWFGSVQRAGRIDNGEHVDNDEQGRTVWLCSAPAAEWSTLWHDMRRLA